MAYDEETAERVGKVLAGRRGIVAKKMMGGLCFMTKDGMVCSVSGRGGMLIRVAPEAREKMLKEPHALSVEMRGRTMMGFVRVAPEGYRTDAALKKWLERGLEGVAAKGAAPPPAKGRKKGK